MNLVAGAQTFPVPVGRDSSLERSKDVVLQMEAQGQGDGSPYDNSNTLTVNYLPSVE